MGGAGSVDIPDLKKLDPRRQDRERGAALGRLFRAAAPVFWAARVAAPKALAAAVLAASALAGGRAFRSWRASRLSLGGVRSTIRPEARAGSLRLDLAAQSSRGQLRWGVSAGSASSGGPASGATGSGATGSGGDGKAWAFGGKTDWAAVLRGAAGGSGPTTTVRVLTNCALAQLVAARDFSGAASKQGRAEASAEVGRAAFSSQLLLGPAAPDGQVQLGGAGATPGALTAAPAPDVLAQQGHAAAEPERAGSSSFEVEGGRAF